MNTCALNTCALNNCTAPARGKYCSRPHALEGMNAPRRIERVARVCARCGGPFEVLPSEIEARPAMYCSRLCTTHAIAAEVVNGERPAARRSTVVNWTRDKDDALRRDYLRVPTRALAKRWSCEPHNVRQRAKTLGLTRSKTPPWTDDEIEILRTLWGTRTIVAVAKRLGRTEIAVRVKAKRLGLYRDECRETYSAQQAAELLGVDAHRVVRWIEAGSLRAKVVPGRGRIGGRGGQRWDIRPKDLRAWILLHPQEVNLRLVAPLAVEFIALIAEAS